MRKGKIIVCAVLALLLCVGAILCASAQDEPSPDAVDLQTSVEEVTWVTRVVEYTKQNKEALLGLLGDGAILVLAFLIKKKSANIKRGTDVTNAAQGAMVSAVNGMIDGYNAMKASYDQYGATEVDRNRVIGVLVAQNTAMLEIMMTAYGSSKNLAQGIKDLMYLKYANYMKQIGDDEQILAIVEAVKQNINSVGIERVDPEQTEVEAAAVEV